MESSQAMRDRQTYHKPTVRRIELLAEEVLGLGCKLDTSSVGKVGESVAFCGSINCNIASPTAS